MAGQWFSPGTSVSSKNKTDRHELTEILLKMTLSAITLTLILCYSQSDVDVFELHEILINQMKCC